MRRRAPVGRRRWVRLVQVEPLWAWGLFVTLLPVAFFLLPLVRDGGASLCRHEISVPLASHGAALDFGPVVSMTGSRALPQLDGELVATDDLTERLSRRLEEVAALTELPGAEPLPASVLLVIAPDVRFSDVWPVLRAAYATSAHVSLVVEVPSL